MKLRMSPRIKKLMRMGFDHLAPMSGYWSFIVPQANVRAEPMFTIGRVDAGVKHLSDLAELLDVQDQITQALIQHCASMYEPDRIAVGKIETLQRAQSAAAKVLGEAMERVRMKRLRADERKAQRIAEKIDRGAR